MTKWIEANGDQASLDREKSGIKRQQMTFSGEALKFFGQLLINSIKVSGSLLLSFSPYFSYLERERAGLWKSDAQGRKILMVNPKHLETLKKGVEAWNKWRKNNPDIKPDLREANLLRANLSEADLSGANISGANLWRADLSGANISGAYLNEAYLWRADLTETDLNRANLAEAYLEGANLRGAENLTIEQLSKVRTLYWAKLDPELEMEVKEKYPHLLEKPKVR